MRRFWLEKNGVVWNLTANDISALDRNFMADPSGLGVKLKVEIFEIENAIFIEDIKHESVDIGGKLYFYSYAHFSRFVNFIGNLVTREPMRLYYSTEGVSYDNKLNPQWYKLVLIKELKKSEIDVKTGALICDIKFASLSRWKKDKLITLELSPYGEALTYPYIYPYFYGGSNNIAVVIDNRGNLPTHCIVRIEAETDMPLFRLIVNGEIIEQAKYNVYIREGSYMVINSDPAAQEASLYTGLNREDIYYLGEKDYTYSNFLTIPSGESMFLFTARNSQFGKVTLLYSLQRELV